MHELVKEAVNDLNSAWELSKAKKDPIEIIDAISDLKPEDVMKLGMNFKKFPLGCDLTEIFVGTCASDVEKLDLLGNCAISDSLGASIHVCAYAFADIAESNGMKPIDLIREVREATEVPLDLDHFGINGPMRFPKNIVKCNGQCYKQGPPFDGCPRDRIHSRLLDKEEEGFPDKEEWVKLSSSVAINLTCVQGGENHAAPLKEAEDIAKLGRKYGKGIEAIMFVGDGQDDLISAFTTGLDMGVDVFVIEGGPFNQAEDRLDAFSRAIAIARVLAPGKVVATNGAYEDECRIGLRTGLNGIITGFPNNHHGYMCGYAPGTAKRGKFGLPRVTQIIREEITCACGCGGDVVAPIGKDQLEHIAAAVKVVGKDNVYPTKVGGAFLGDAHWACISSTPLFNRVNVNTTVSEIRSKAEVGEIEGTVSLFGGRFVSWAMANALDGLVDDIIISDADSWVENVTVDNLTSALKTSVHGANGDDKVAYNDSDVTIITSTIPGLNRKLSNLFRVAITLV